MNAPGMVLAGIDDQRQFVPLEHAQALFIETYPRYGTIAHAARACGISPDAARDWVREHEGTESSFARAWSYAKEHGCDEILHEMIEATRQNPGTMPSQVSRMFLIKAQRPEYRDQLNVRHSGAVLSARVDLAHLEPAERAQLLGLVARKLEALGPPLNPPADVETPPDA